MGNWDGIAERQMLDYMEDEIAQPFDAHNIRIDNNDAAGEPDDVLEEVRNVWNVNNELTNDPNFQARFMNQLQAELDFAANVIDVPQLDDPMLGGFDDLVRQPLRRGNFGPVIANRIRFLNGLEQQARQGITIGVNQMNNAVAGQQDQQPTLTVPEDQTEPLQDIPH